MSKYSVEKLLELADLLEKGTPNWYRETFGNWKDSVHIGDNSPKGAADMLREYAAHLTAQAEWPSEEDVEIAARAAWNHVPRGRSWEELTKEGRDSWKEDTRASLQSVRPPVGVGSDELIGWVFQHEDTGRMCFCENDGINTPEVFAKNNPRHSLVSPAYASRHTPTKD